MPVVLRRARLQGGSGYFLCQLTQSPLFRVVVAGIVACLHRDLTVPRLRTLKCFFRFAVTSRAVSG